MQRPLNRRARAAPWRPTILRSEPPSIASAKEGWLFTWLRATDGRPCSTHT
jgi:hypothetical protein